MDQFWDTGHLAAVLFTIVAAAGLVAAARRWPGRWCYAVCVALGAALIINQSVDTCRGLWEHNWSVRYDLPLNLCDVAAYIAGVALILRRRWWVETTYFWAMAGTTLGLLFPDATLHAPSYAYFEYYVDHSGVILAALLLVMGLGCVPGVGAFRRACVTAVAYTVLVAAFDLVTGADYFALMAKRAAGSMTPLGLLSPWPWYIPEAVPIAIAVFAMLDLPFRRLAAPGPAPPVAGAAAT